MMRFLRSACFAALCMAAASAAGMDIKVVGDQLIMSGPIDGTELARLRDAIAGQSAGTIKGVILRDSPGGDVWTSLRIGELIRDNGWSTGVSGYCFSGCALMFLGGVERHFTDDKPVLQTQVAFHATYYTSDSLRAFPGSVNPEMTYKARNWIRQFSGGKLSDAMLDRFDRLEKTEFVHFFDSRRLPRAGQPSVFVCSHAVGDPKQKCRPITGADVYAEGIVTSQLLMRSNDRAGAPAESK
jgi:hypothetical protein